MSRGVGRRWGKRFLSILVLSMEPYVGLDHMT